MRNQAILFSYWLLFILAPSVAIFSLIGISVKGIVISSAVFIVLVLIGERCFPHWKRFWTKG